MKYRDFERIKERWGFKSSPSPFADWHEDKDNGFVVLPDGFPVNNLDPIYQIINLQTIWGLAYMKAVLD